jgi:hypothetical protein
MAWARSIGQQIQVSAQGTPGITYGLLNRISQSATAAGVVTLTNTLVTAISRGIAAVAQGISGFSRVATYYRTIPATAQGSAGWSRWVRMSWAVVASGGALVVSSFRTAKTFVATALGLASSTNTFIDGDPPPPELTGDGFRALLLRRRRKPKET